MNLNGILLILLKKKEPKIMHGSKISWMLLHNIHNVLLIERYHLLSLNMKRRVPTMTLIPPFKP